MTSMDETEGYARGRGILELISILGLTPTRAPAVVLAQYVSDDDRSIARSSDEHRRHSHGTESFSARGQRDVRHDDA